MLPQDTGRRASLAVTGNSLDMQPKRLLSTDLLWAFAALIAALAALRERVRSSKEGSSESEETGEEDAEEEDELQED